MEHGSPPARPGATLPDRHGRRRSVRRVTGFALTVMLVGGGVTQAVVSHVAAAERAAAAEAVLAEQARRVRVDDAATARLAGAAVGYAGVRRTEALEAAREAVRTAGTVVVDAAADLPPETVTPLGEATAALEALIDSAPSTRAVTIPFQPAALRDPLARTAEASRRGSAAPAHRSGTRGPVDAAVDDVVPAAADVVGDDHAVQAPDAGPGTPRGTAPAAADAPADLTTADAGPAPDAGGEPGPPGPVTSTGALTDSAAAPDTTAPPSSPEPPEAVDGRAEQLAALDLGVSAEMVAAAQQVAQLSAQVQAAADVAAAEAAAAAAARAAAEEAARVAAESLARAVAAVDAAPNGEVPVELLCGVSFTTGVLLRCDAAQALEDLNTAYRADHGVDLEVTSSYRSFGAQVAVKAAKGGLAATPGRSNHGRALAVDLGGFGGVGSFDDPDYLWMKGHAEAFGWHHPRAMEPGGSGPLEPWHWEYDTEDL